VKKIFLILFIVISSFLFFGCTRTMVDNSSNTQSLSNNGNSDVTNLLDNFKNAYNSKDSESIKTVFEPSVKDMVTYSFINENFGYTSINSMTLLSQNDSSTGKIVIVSINNDSKPTKFTLKNIEGKWYIVDFQSGFKLMDYAFTSSKIACCTVLTIPTLSTDGVLSMNLRNNYGSAVKDIKIIGGTENCKDIKQQSTNSDVVNNGDEFELIAKCIPRAKGTNFITVLTLQYFDVSNAVDKTYNLSIGIYDR